MGPSFSCIPNQIYRSWNPGEHDAQWYVDNGFSYLVLSEALVKDPNRTILAAENYRQFFIKFAIMKEFSGPQLGFADRKIWIFRVPSQLAPTSRKNSPLG